MEFDPGHRLTLAKRLVGWMVSLLAPDVRSDARAELRAEGLEVIGPPAVTVPTDGLSGRLRSAATVLDGDAVLSTMRQSDWTVLAAEHRQEPFGRVQRRALIARPDCPDALTNALLTPWDSFVAGRLVARRQPVPRWTWQAALARIGEMRPSFLRHVLSDETAEEMILTTPRLDLLVRAVDGYDHNHHKEAQAFWACAGGLLRRHLGADRSVWPAAAAALPSHPGTFANLLRRVEKTPIPVPAEQADLRILAQAPDAVLADAVADLSDPLLTHMERRDLHPRRTREHLISMVLDRFVSAGIPPRGLFARWAYTTRSTPATRSWAQGLDPLLDEANKRSAAYDVTLRRLLAAGSPPPGAVSDLVGALRACADPIESEALLTSVLGENGSPPGMNSSTLTAIRHCRRMSCAPWPPAGLPRNTRPGVTRRPAPHAGRPEPSGCAHRRDRTAPHPQPPGSPPPNPRRASPHRRRTAGEESPRQGNPPVRLHPFHPHALVRRQARRRPPRSLRSAVRHGRAVGAGGVLAGTTETAPSVRGHTPGTARRCRRTPQTLPRLTTRRQRRGSPHPWGR